MSVTAIYELPVPIWISTEVLGERISSGLGRVTFDVFMPTSAGPVGGPPEVPGVQSLAALTGHAPVDQSWVHRFAAFTSDNNSTALCRIVVQTTSTGDAAGFDNETYDLARVIDVWFDHVRTWAEIVTGQDLDPNHQVHSATSHGARLSLLDPKPTSDGPIALTLTTPRIMPVPAAAWRLLLGDVANGKLPPLEEQLSRDCRAAFARGQYRRSVIDAASAAEIVLHRLISSRLTEANMPNGAFRKKLRNLDKQPLGELVHIADRADVDLDVDIDGLQQLVEIRNDAIHRGIAPHSSRVIVTVQAAINLLGRHGLLKRSSEALDYGDHWVASE